MSTRFAATASFLGVIAALIAVACQGPSGNGVFFPTLPPGPAPAGDGGVDLSRDPFRKLSDVLEARCGTLDCHGASARNFRVYGTAGLRLPPNVPGKSSTTDPEYQKTYESLVLIQPEILSRIYRDHGAQPQRWIIITKGRGAEHHKGGSRMTPGDPADRCITTWLTGATDVDACIAGADTQPPGGPGF
jgi:hypothetical protein